MERKLQQFRVDASTGWGILSLERSTSPGLNGMRQMNIAIIRDRGRWRGSMPKG
jgi:hypothetical protein